MAGIKTAGLRGRKGFHGGIHVTDGYDKALTRDGKIRTYEPELVRISMEQSRGNRCRLLVRTGDTVEKGQQIGAPIEYAAAPVHASVDGVVERVELREEAEGDPVEVCVIRRGDVHREPCENQEEDRSGRHRQDYRKQAVNLGGISREEILEGLETGGVVGMGGAGFPAFRKYGTTRRIHTILINGAECEPFLTCDERLMLEHGMEILNGARVLARCVEASKVLVCVETNKTEAARHLKKLLREDYSQMEIRMVPARYPQGGERQLIQTVLGMEVPEGKLPMELGVIVSNVATAKAAADCILGGRPLTHRCVTVSGAVKQPGNFMVPVGTSLKSLVALCQGVTEQNNVVILGGPMTGRCVARNWDGDTEIGEVEKTVSGITILKHRARKESPCIRCGGCVQVCPAGLAPFQIEFAWLKGDREQCDKLHADQCILCGCCSYVCPAKRELAHRIAMARFWPDNGLSAMKKTAQKSDEAVQMPEETVRKPEKMAQKLSDTKRVRRHMEWDGKTGLHGPYLRSGNTTRRVMGHVLIALFPALVGSIYFFGWRSLLLTVCGAVFCMLWELLWQVCGRQEITVLDLSAAVTGVLLAFNLPVSVPLWAVAAASFFAIILVKQFFGGIGNNFANPALMGRLLLMLAWPQTLAVCPPPRTLAADAVSAATVLTALKSGVRPVYSYWQMFVGEIPGALGETSKLLLLIGFVYLCWQHMVNVQAALAYLITTVAITFVLGPQGLFTGDLPGNLLSGSLILGGCYMLTDYSFASRTGKLLFGVAAGVLTGLLRVYGRYPEGVCFGILTANCLGGLLAVWYRPHVYGVRTVAKSMGRRLAERMSVRRDERSVGKQ